MPKQFYHNLSKNQFNITDVVDFIDNYDWSDKIYITEIGQYVLKEMSGQDLIPLFKGYKEYKLDEYENHPKIVKIISSWNPEKISNELYEFHKFQIQLHEITQAFVESSDEDESCDNLSCTCGGYSNTNCKCKYGL